MASALVGREALWYGDLPPVCVKTGEPADGDVAVRFSHVPPWTFLLLLAGILPFFVALLFVPERIPGRLPITVATVDRYHAHRPWQWGCWGLILAGPALSAALGQGQPLLATGSGLVGLLVVEARRANDWVAVRPVRNTPLLELRRVNPSFGAAVAERATAGRR